MVIKIVHRWTRLSSTKWEDVWRERLRFVDPQQIAFFTWRGSQTLKIEAYCSEHTAKKLVKRFGGRVTRLAKDAWKGPPARPREPMSIRGKLKIFADKPAWRRWRKAGKTRAIFIPAGMAFGTGEHATTASCLRLLSGYHAAFYRPTLQPWTSARVQAFSRLAPKHLAQAASRQLTTIQLPCESRRRTHSITDFL